MPEPATQGDFERRQAEAIDRIARNIDRLCAKRVKDLSDRLSTERAPLPLAYLVTLARPVHFLAMRAIANTDRPSGDPQQGSLLVPWRFHLHRYLVAVVRINNAIDRAVQAGNLPLRDPFTGLPLDAWQCPDPATSARFEAEIFDHVDWGSQGVPQSGQGLGGLAFTRPSATSGRSCSPPGI